MDFLEDIFERKHRRSGRDYRDHNHRHDDHDHHEDRDGGMESLRPIIAKVVRNKPLLMGLIIGVILILVIAAALLFAFLPLMVQVFEYVNKNGIKGVVDIILPILERVWKGQE